MSAHRKRLLIVEDQRLVAADLASTLGRLGYQVVGSVGSGEQAVESARALAPDLILMDIRLRGAMDGIQAAAAIRSRQDVPIVYLTAYADEETVFRARATSPFGYVVKPFSERELRAAIEVAIYKHETDRLLAEERALRRAAEEFKLLVDGVRDYAIFMLDASGRVASWNEGARRIKGYAAEEILGRHFECFYPPEAVARGEPQAFIDEALRVGRAEREGLRVRNDGSRFWGHVEMIALRDGEGRLHGFGKVTRDLSERRRAEEQRERLITELQDAVAMRDEFLQIASHELKTPLTPLQLQLDNVSRMIEESSVLNARLTAKIETARRQTVRLRRLVESLLDVSRITAGRVELEREPVELSALAREVVERLLPEAQRAGSAVSVGGGGGEVIGRWDRLRVEQILTNLLSNAIKYGAGKPIRVEIAREGAEARASVKDQGIGIDGEALGRIFERFERAVSPRNYGGLGLGLFIARQFAQAHGGTLLAESAPGEGSTFTLVLPL